MGLFGIKQIVFETNCFRAVCKTYEKPYKAIAFLLQIKISFETCSFLQKNYTLQWKPVFKGKFVLHKYVYRKTLIFQGNLSFERKALLFELFLYDFNYSVYFPFTVGQNFSLKWTSVFKRKFVLHKNMYIKKTPWAVSDQWGPGLGKRACGTREGEPICSSQLGQVPICVGGDEISRPCAVFSEVEQQTGPDDGITTPPPTEPRRSTRKCRTREIEGERTVTILGRDIELPWRDR